MANYALQLGTDGKVVFGNSTGVQNATKLSGTINLYGGWFKDNSDNAFNELFRVWDGTSAKLMVYCSHLFGGSRIVFANAQWPGDCTVLDLGTIPATMAASSLYKLTFSLDPAATTRCNATLYDTDGTTILASGGSNANTNASALQTTAGMGGVVMGFQGSFGSGLSMTVDDLILNDGTSNVFDADYNEGTGSSTTEAVASVSGTITGTFSWVPLAPPPDHGTVSFTRPTIAYNGTGTALVTWFDATNTEITPQPPTTWSVLNLGATINPTTGDYTGQGAGTATVRASSGGIHADGTLTMTRKLTITGSMTVS